MQIGITGMHNIISPLISAEWIQLTYAATVGWAGAITDTCLDGPLRLKSEIQ